jgi:hypothetical protein
MARISPDGPELVDQGPVEARTAELQPRTPEPTPGRSLVLSRAGVAG